MAMATDKELEKLQRSDHDTLIRVETKMDGLVNEMRNANATSAKVQADHEARIRVLEVAKETSFGSVSGTDKFKNLVIATCGLILTAVTAYAMLRK